MTCVVLLLGAQASHEGPYVLSPILLGTSALVLLLTILAADDAGELLAHALGRATDNLLVVVTSCVMVELAQDEEGARWCPATVALLCSACLLAGILAGGVLMSVAGLTVTSMAVVAVSLLYGALLSLGISVQQRDRGSYVIVRSSRDMARIADAQAQALAAELGSLTPREAEVLPLLLQHQGADAVAERLGISRNTAKSHVAHIYEKAGVNSRQQLIDLASARVIDL